MAGVEQEEASSARPVPALACFVLLARFLGVAIARRIAHDRGKGWRSCTLVDVLRIAGTPLISNSD